MEAHVLTETALAEILAVYLVAFGAMLLLARLRISPVVALILTGVVCGPSGVGLVSSMTEVETLAELGVLLLLFTVGLDFPVSELRRIWKTAAFGGSLQVGATTLLAGAAAALLFGSAAATALLVGTLVAMSSTAIVIRALEERNEVHAPHGQMAVGVLLVQDLAVVIALALVPALSGSTSGAAVAALTVRLAAALVLVVLVGRVALPWLLRLAMRSRRREAFSLALLLASGGTAWVCAGLGLPTAVGAFLGGFVLAESEFSAQAQADVRPLRDVLASLFFVSVGMLLDIPALVAQWPLVAGLSLVVLTGKAAVSAMALLVMRVPLRVALAAGLALAQVGEFSLVLGEVGIEAGLLDTATWHVLLSIGLVTMLATPALVSTAPALAGWLSGRSRASRAPVESPGPDRVHHVIILGYGLGGRAIADTLRAAGRSHVVIDLNGATVTRARAQGVPIMYGDASNPETLVAAGLHDADALVSVLNDAEATRQAVRAARSRHATLPVIARTRYRLEADRLLAAGATTVLVEEIETSLEVLARLLALLELPPDLVETQRQTLRSSLAGPSG
jgi:CPA2 family monovalent cation:H+ antiporter-2